MKKILLAILILNISTVSYAQNRNYLKDLRPLNSVHLNLFGDASIISINYERQFVISPTFIISSKLGLGYNEEFRLCLFGSCSDDPKKYLTIPHHFTGNLGTERHFFEFGLGGTIISGDTTQPYILYPIVGYRFLPLDFNKINFRIHGQFPFISEMDDILFFHFGLSVGLSF